MCRLFGINAGDQEVHVEYWLLEAPDSMLAESQRNPDGTGIGWFAADEVPHIDKQPLRAYADPEFSRQARSVTARTLITHIRSATTGQAVVANTHPFLIDGRLMAHNGGFGELAAVEAQLGAYLAQVQGQTDSERYAALIARFTAEHGGHVGKGIAAAAGWLAEHVPLYALNCLVATPGHLWALRYPDQRALHIARRRIDPATGTAVHGSSALSEHRVDCEVPVDVVIVASERIDAGADWRMLEPGELIHVGPDLTITSRLVLRRPPARLQRHDGATPNVDSF